MVVREKPIYKILSIAILVLICSALLFSGCEKTPPVTQPPAPPTQPETKPDTPEKRKVVQLRLGSELADAVKVAHSDFYRTVGEAMRETASTVKMAVSDEPVEAIEVYVKEPKTRLMIVNCPIKGVDSLPMQQLERGADLLFIFVQLPEDSELASGFYTVRFLKDPKGRDAWLAQFRDPNGRVILQKPAILKQTTNSGDPKRVRVEVSIKIHPKPLSIEVDIRIVPQDPKTPAITHIMTSFGIGESDIKPVSKPETAVRIGQALEKYSTTVSSLLREASEIYGKAILDEWISLSMSKIEFTIYTVFKGVDSFTLDDLAKGQDFFFGYFPSIIIKGVRLKDGFYKVRLVKEAGLWKACFYEKESVAKAEELKVKLERRTIVETLPAETRLRYSKLSGGVIIDETLGPAFRIDFDWSDPTPGQLKSKKGAFIVSPRMDSG